MSTLSDYPRPEERELPDVLPFDAAGGDDDDGADANAVPDGEAGHDALDSGGGDDPDDRPPSGAVLGLPCRAADGISRPTKAFTLCAVVILPDPDFPQWTDDPDYIDAGQELDGYDGLRAARAMCDAYALVPEILGVHFEGFDLPEANFLVINDRRGNEVHRRPVLRAA